MGRMLDALSRSRGRLVPASRLTQTAVVEAELTPVVVAPPSTHSEPPIDESIPYIEIGGPTLLTNRLPGPSKVTLIPVPPPKVEPPEPIKSPWFEPDRGMKYLSILYQPVPESSASQLGKPIADELVVYHKPDHPISVQYRSLWREMAEQLQHPHQALLFTGTHDQSGTTTVLLNLAITVVREPTKRILVIDANPASPAVFARLGVAPSPGLHELLHRGLPAPLAVHPTRVPGLSVMVSGFGEGNRGVIDRDRLARLLAQLRSRYDWVVVDAPAWGEDGISVWAELCDASFLVLRQADSDHPDVEAAHDLLHRDGKLRGYLMTRS